MIIPNNPHTISRIRLIYTDKKYPYPGMCGTLITFQEDFHAIVWDDDSVEFRNSIESDEFFADLIIDGYSLLTMDDVLKIPFRNFEDFYRIKDGHRREEILDQLLKFTEPLQKKRKLERMVL